MFIQRTVWRIVVSHKKVPYLTFMFFFEPCSTRVVKWEMGDDEKVLYGRSFVKQRTEKKGFFCLKIDSPLHTQYFKISQQSTRVLSKNTRFEPMVRKYRLKVRTGFLSQTHVVVSVDGRKAPENADQYRQLTTHMCYWPKISV